MGQHENALPDLNTAIRLRPTFARAFFDRGQLRFSRDDVPQAITDLSEAIRLDPKFAVAYECRAQAYYEAGEYGKAVADGKQGLRVDAERPSLCVLLAQMLAVCPDAKLRDGRKAVELATKACKLTNDRWFESFQALAAAYAEIGKFDEAIKAQKKAFELLPASLTIIRERGEERLKLYEARKPVRIRAFIGKW